MDENKQSFSANKLKAIVEEVVNKAVDPIKETLADHSRILEDHTKRLQALSGDMEQVRKLHMMK